MICRRRNARLVSTRLVVASQTVDLPVVLDEPRFHVPGYGKCLAADIGGAVQGPFVDVWVKTERAAHRWGVRTVTIRFL